MERQENTRRRMKALDGSSFRFERKMGNLYVNDMPVHVRVLQGGIVALLIKHKTVQVSGADYWEMVYDEVQPTKQLAGMLQAQLNEIAEQLKEIAARKTETNQ